MLQEPTPATPAPGFIVRQGAVSPNAVYEGALAQRQELSDQLDRLQESRSGLSERLSDPMVSGADRRGLEARIGDMDQRIAALDKQIASANLQVAQAAGVPGAIVRPSVPNGNNDPPMAGIIGVTFIVLCLFPLTIAWSRRLWRRGAVAISALPAEVMERLSRLDQAVESIAVEVERIGEGQRFMTRLFTDNGGRLGAGAAQPVELPARDATPVRSRNPGGPV
jgi:hypothetical protein